MKIKNLKFKIIDMHCTSCSIAIDGELEDTDGVVKSNTNYARAQTEVEFDTQKLTEGQIIDIIAKAGYTAKPAN